MNPPNQSKTVTTTAMSLFQKLHAFTDPAIHLKLLYLSFKNKGEQGGNPVITVKDLEILAIAEKNYRGRIRAYFRDNFLQSHKPCLPIHRTFESILPTKNVKIHHLLNALLGVWIEDTIRDGKGAPVPVEFRNLVKRYRPKVLPEIAHTWGIEVRKGPAVQPDNRFKPKLKNLIRHLIQHLSCTRNF